MNLINLIKFGAAAVALLFAYWIGVQDGRDSEELKNARAQIVQLSETVKTYEAHYKNQAIAMAELRVSESAARADSDRLRSRIANLEKEPEQLPIETQFDASSWEQNVDDYCRKLEELLTTVEKRLAEKIPGTK